MSADSSTTPAPPEQIRAVPVRHPGRWVAAAVIAVLAAMFVHMLVTNPVFQWDFMVDNMFSDAVQSLIDDGTYTEVLSRWGVEDGAIDDPTVNPTVG